MSRNGPGLLLRDIGKGEEQVDAAAQIIAHIEPDILLLTDFDYDYEGVALGAFAELIASHGHEMPHRFATEPNSGLATGLDMDGDGRAGSARDSQGYGWFTGDGGLAILSTRPIVASAVQDHSGLLWQKLPGATLPSLEGAPFPSVAALALQRLSSTGHWVVPIDMGGGAPLNVLAFAATPPVFDGPEDRNGLRNADEIRFWQMWMDGALGPVPEGPMVVMGNANLDPVDGDGRWAAINALRTDPRLQDPEPRSIAGGMANDADHRGDPSLDTVDWPDNAPGNLRVSYILPDAALEVVESGVFWPSADHPLADLLRGERGGVAGPHRLVWTDIRR